MQTDPQRPNRDFMARILAAMCLLAILIGVVLVWMPMAAQAEDTALLIGVGKYQDRSFNGLPFAVNDVRQFETVLADRGYVVRSLYYDDDQQPDLDQVPLRRHILAEVESILRRAGSGDRVVLAYSGHGVNIDGAAYLCPTDSDLRDRETLIPVERIRQWIKESRATHVSFFCDACQEEIGQKAIMRNLGSDVRSGMIPSENFRVALANSNLGLKQQKRTIVQSCRPAQVAYADEELRHGVFFHFLIQAFKGSGDTDRNGELEHQELVSYLAKNVQDYVADRFGQRQFVYPEISGDSDLPLMQLAEGPTWLPNDCQPHERARLVSIRGFGGTQRCYSHVVLTPRWTDVADPAKSNPLLGVDGQPISIELVLVPQLTFEMPPTFYISRDKVSVRLWRAYESAAPGKMDALAAKERQRFSADPDSPMFWVTGMEALAFCRDMWKGTEDGIEFRGTLPTPAQWDAAYG
ncbi:MAG: caspase family protein, partial [Planctomycetota bacterium]